MKMDMTINRRTQKYIVNRVKQLENALKDFCNTVELTGGVEVDLTDNQGLYFPVASEDWTDLGRAYVKACTTLGRKPKIVKAEHSHGDSGILRFVNQE